MNNTRTYTDFSLNFNAHPVTGDVSIITDAEAVKASVKNLILTHNYERNFHSEIGTTPLLFENTSPLLTASLTAQIQNLIKSFEPRADLLDVIVNVDGPANGVNITIVFRIVNTQNPITVDVILERVR